MPEGVSLFMTRTCFAAILVLFLAIPVQAGSSPGVPTGGNPPGSAPVSATGATPASDTPVAKPAGEKPVGQVARPVKQEGKGSAGAGKRALAGSREKSGIIRLKAVTCRVDRKGREQVLLTFSRPYRPALKTLPGEKPRIYFDIPGGVAEPGIVSTLDAPGPLIRQVRIHPDASSGSLRVAVELVPERDYIVRPVVYRKESQLLLEIEPKIARTRVKP